MSIVVETEALVTYTCTLSEKDSQKVIKYAKKHNLSLEGAVEKLYWGSEDTIDLYKNSVESDFSTQDITSATLEGEDE